MDVFVLLILTAQHLEGDQGDRLADYITDVPVGIGGRLGISARTGRDPSPRIRFPGYIDDVPAGIVGPSSAVPGLTTSTVCLWAL